MWKAAAILLVVVILGTIPFFLASLRRRAALNPSSFALTVSAGTSLAILVAFYIGLLDVLVARSETGLYLLGVLVAGANFAIVLGTGRVFYRLYERLVTKGPSRRA
jgi:hypothetical protein